MPIPSVPSSPSHRPQIATTIATASPSSPVRGSVVMPPTTATGLTDPGTDDANKWNNKPPSLEENLMTTMRHDNSNNDSSRRDMDNSHAVADRHAQQSPADSQQVADDFMDTDDGNEQMGSANDDDQLSSRTAGNQTPIAEQYSLLDQQQQQIQKQTPIPKKREVLLHAKRHDEDVINLSKDRIRADCVGELYAGSKFNGTQKCGTTSYEVDVDILNVNLKESTLSGYLKIKGLTSEFPELTTFFQAEIIGPKYPFHTRKWQADHQSDLSHWKKFPSFIQSHLENFTKDDTYPLVDNHQEEPSKDDDFIYMRWKEMFLVPDHHINAIHGASFAGFYYICYQRSTKHIKGYYFFRHHKDWFQELNLDHVPDFGASHYEFR